MRGYGVGLAQGGWQFAKGTAGLTYNSVAHPVQTFNNGVATLDATAGFITYAIQDPSEAGNAISQGFANTYNSFETQSPYEQGKAVGNIVGQIEVGVVAGAAASKTAQALKGESVFSQAAGHAMEKGRYSGLSKSEVTNIASDTKVNFDIKGRIQGINTKTGGLVNKQYYGNTKTGQVFINTNIGSPTLFSSKNPLEYIRRQLSNDIRKYGRR